MLNKILVSYTWTFNFADLDDGNQDNCHCDDRVDAAKMGTSFTILIIIVTK